jgi:hypothetical protein
MRQKLPILFLLLASLIVAKKSTSQTLTVGSGSFTTASNAYGIMASVSTANSWSRNAIIYPASVVNSIPTGSGITSLEFLASNASSASLVGVGGTFKIYVKNTSNADLGTANIDWVAEAATCTLVYSGDPASIVGTTSGFKQFPFTSSYTYTGGALEILFEYTQTTAPAATILWTYDNNGTIPAYTDNQNKYNFGTGTPVATTAATNNRHPNMKVNYTPNIFANDMALTAFVAPTTANLTAGAATTITVTVKNNGTATQNNVPVYYKIDNGTAVGPVNTGSLAQNATQNVTLPNYTPTSGYHTIKAYTSLTGDQSNPNDTLSATILAGPITSYPFIETFTNAIGWTANANLWSIVTVTTQANGIGGRASSANFYNVAANATDTLKSPVFNFTGITKPNLAYNFTHQSSSATPEPDILKVIVSTDGGTTWGAPIFTKAADGSPSLNTIAFSTIQYNPQAKGDWRHEMIDLTAYAGQANVKIGFVAISGFGNQLVIDNVLLSDVATYTSQAVTATGAQTASAGATINFTTIIPKGSLKVAKINGTPTSSATTVIATNTTATTQDGSIFTPTLIFNGFWYTVTYDSLATYSISIDLSTVLTAPAKNKLYILKRSVQNDSWIAVNTTLSGNILTASGLTAFSDFTIGGDANNPVLPIVLESFQGQLKNGNAILSWATSNEINVDKFEIEKSYGGTWKTIVTTTAKGTGGNSYQATDANLTAGKWLYRLKMIDKDGKFTYSQIVTLEMGKGQFVLNQNYPNPVKGSTQLSYQINTEANVMIELLTKDGRKIATLVNQQQAVGSYNITLDVTKYALASGNYIYRMIAVDKNNQELFQSTKTITVVQ